MERPKYEVADIFRRLSEKVSSLRGEKRKAFQSVIRCRTAALGGHHNRCTDCPHEEFAYNSCLNRHCPKCRGGTVFDWVEARQQELINTPYFHLVFTLVSELRRLCALNKRLFYDLLFEASRDTLLTLGRNNLELKLGFFGVLHTWNQELEYHPHIHYVAAAGGFSTTSGAWAELRRGNEFFLPVRTLSNVFQGKLISLLKKNHSKLFFGEELSHLQNEREFEHFLSRACRHDPVVYAKEPFASPECLLKYLACYTHKVGISNYRITEMTDAEVTFTARDNTDWTKKRYITISHETFLRRFMSHILPKGFRKVRFYGFMSQNQKRASLAAIRKAQGPSAAPLASPRKSDRCPSCKTGSLRLYAVFKPHSKQYDHSTPHLHAAFSSFCVGPPS